VLCFQPFSPLLCNPTYLSILHLQLLPQTLKRWFHLFNHFQATLHYFTETSTRLITLFIPQIDYENMKQIMDYNHAKNVKSALKNLIEKLKKQQNAATAASTSASGKNDKAATTEADDDNEESGEESPKKKSPVKKPVTSKKAKLSEEVVEEVSEEEDLDKKVVVKKGPAAKKGTAVKKGVGKATAPKKASAGGPKSTAKGKGKKAGKTEEAEDEADDVEAEVEGGEDDAAKGEDEDDIKMKEANGKLHESLPIAPTPSQGDPQENRIVPAGPVMTGPPLYITIEGEEYTYTPYDVYVAQSHEITLEHYLTWKKSNDYSFYIDPVPYSL
jgi:hypothetical protein